MGEHPLEPEFQELQVSVQRYREFLSQSSTAIWRFELEVPLSTSLPESEQIEHIYRHAYLAECNPRLGLMYGYDDCSELVGSRLTDFMPADDPTNTEYLTVLIRSGYRLTDVESHEVDRFGEDKYFLNSLVATVENGYVYRAWGTQLDITHLKQAEQKLRESASQLEEKVHARTVELEHANRELEGFTYSVSHDLRAPLRSILSHSRMLLDDYGDRLDAEGTENLQTLSDSAARMARLVEDLLRFARLAKAPVQKREVDLSALASRIANEEPSPGAEISVQQGMHVSADPDLLGLVLRNLLENAFKFSKPGRPLVLEVGRDEKGFFVRDNGIGFDMAYAHKLFQPFERLHRQEDYPGTGIGLANVKRIIERHGGKVWAEGVENEGATFYFTLPSAD